LGIVDVEVDALAEEAVADTGGCVALESPRVK